MQSPFKVFRKYQKQVMVVMVFAAIMLFGLGDTMMKMTGSKGGRQAGKVVVETNVGKITQVEMQNLQYRRRVIHRFVHTAYLRSHPEMEKSPMGGYIASMMVQRYGFGDPSERGILSSWLYRQEARKLGIVVTNRQVEDYIDGVTDRKLSSKKFQEIVRDMQIGAKELFDFIRDELQALTAFRMKQPIVVASPEKYWEYFQELNVRQKIEVAAIPVSEFTAQTPEPTPAQITKLFEEHKEDNDQSFEGEYKPGFRQPRKVKLQYLTFAFAEYEAKAKAGAPITDKEVEDYYEANKNIESRFQEGELRLDDDASPLDPGFAPEKGEKMPRDQEDEADENTETPKKTDDKSEGKPGKPEDKPSQESEKPEAEKPDAAKPKAKPDDKPDCTPGVDDEPKNEAAAESEKPEKAPAQEGNDKGDDKGDDQDKPKTSPPDETKASKTETEAKDEAAGEDKDEAPEPPRGPTLSPGKSKPHVAPQIKYKPLDDELRDGIRDTLLHKRAQKLMKDQIAKVRDAMSKVAAGFAVSTEVKLTDPDAKQLVELERRSEAELSKIAKTFGLKYDKTPLISKFDLSELPDLGKALEPGSQDRFRDDSTPLYEQAFDGDALCRVFESQDLLESHTYLWWKVEDVAMHVPDLQEPGVREQVITALKRQAALALAEKRANELADRVPKGEKSIAEALAGETVTGDAKGPELKTEESKEFSFWREPTVPNVRQNRQQPVDFDDPGIGKNPRSRKFMQKVFNQMDVGDVGVALNGDASIYYVVKVLSRRDADREAFKDARLFAPDGPYSFLAQLDQQTVVYESSERFEKKYAVKWHNVPNREQMQMPDDDE